MSLPSHLTYRHSPLLLHTQDNEDGSVLEAALHDWPPDKLLVRHSEMVIQQGTVALRLGKPQNPEDSPLNTVSELVLAELTF